MNEDIRHTNGDSDALERADVFMTFQPLAKWEKFIGGSGGLKSVLVYGE